MKTLTQRQENLVADQKAKNEVTLPVDPKNVYQVRHLRLLEK